MKSRPHATSVARAAGFLAALLTSVVTTAALAAEPGAATDVLPVGDAEAGAAKAAVCSACHGVNGNSVNPEWPNLASQHHQYAFEQLQLFKSMVRTNAIMQAQAMLLTPQDMADLAAYFEVQAPVGLEADPSLVELGERIYRAGDPARGIPSCKSCHGPDGSGNGPAKWPLVRAQHSLYTYTQLQAYANRTRYVAVEGQIAPPVQAEMMYEVAARLTDEEMRAVASFIQGLR
jgi:cytochrome c553